MQKLILTTTVFFSVLAINATVQAQTNLFAEGRVPTQRTRPNWESVPTYKENRVQGQGLGAPQYHGGGVLPRQDAGMIQSWDYKARLRSKLQKRGLSNAPRQISPRVNPMRRSIQNGAFRNYVPPQNIRRPLLDHRKFPAHIFLNEPALKV